MASMEGKIRSNANSAPEPPTLDVTRKLNHHGIPARKISRMYQSGHDLDAVVRGRPLRVEVKSRAQGFGRIYNWLDDRDVLIVNP